MKIKLLPLIFLAGLGLLLSYKLARPGGSDLGDGPPYAHHIDLDGTYTDINGQTFRLTDFKGKFVLLNIWTPWCQLCREELPIIQEFQSLTNLVTIGLIYRETSETAHRFFKKHLNPYQHVVPLITNKQLVTWGIRGFPQSFLFDKESKLIYKKTGPLTPTELEAVKGLVR